MTKSDPGHRSKIFNQEQDAFIRERYVDISVAELHVLVNQRFGLTVTLQQVKSYVHNHRINSGRTGQFAPGSRSWNKGKTGYMGANATSFKPGQLPHNKRRLWSERVNKDGFIEISVPERNPHTGFCTRYRHKHVWLWEYHHGKVPRGHAVVFIDGDKSNVVIENLMLLTRAELLAANLHGYKDQPPELKPTVLALVKMEAKAGIRTRPGRGRRRR